MTEACGCTCLTEPAPLGGEIFPVWDLGLVVTMDDYVWKRLKSHLERLGADVVEHHPDPETTTRTFAKKPGPKVGTKYKGRGNHNQSRATKR